MGLTRGSLTWALSLSLSLVSFWWVTLQPGLRLRLRLIRWLAGPQAHHQPPEVQMSLAARRARVAVAWVILVAATVCWPLAAFWWARDEPQFVLGLSFLAITIEAASLLTASQVHAEQGESGD